MSSRRKKKSGSRILKVLLILVLLFAVVLAAAGVNKYIIHRGGGSQSEEASAEEMSSEEPAAPEKNDEEQDSEEAEIRKIVDSMSLHQKVSQMFIATPEALTGYGQVTQSGDATKGALEQTPIGGLLYFSGNLESQQQTSEMISKVQEYAQEIMGMKMFISVDEEGGKVARVADSLGTTVFEPMFNYRNEGPDTAYANASVIAHDIGGLGFNLDYAPVADTWSNSANKVIGSRAYSDDYQQTAELVSSAVRGFHEGGVMCTLKHFPGHGDTAEDSHAGSAYVNKNLEQLQQEDLIPFAAGIEAGADMVMMGHITVPSVDEMPASLSRVWVTDILRGQMGYDGAVITDSLIMGAVSNKYSQSEIVVKAVQAGDDILLIQSDLQTSEAAVEAAVSDGSIDEQQIDESVYRILKLKKKYGLIQN